MNLKHKGPPYYDHIYNGNTGWNTQELYRRKTNEKDDTYRLPL